MPRVTHTALVAQGAYGAYAANAADLNMIAADATNKEQVVFTGAEIIIAHNTGVSARTVTVTSVNDPFGRTKDVAAYSLSAGEYAALGPFELDGWLQTDGKLYFEASHLDVKFAVIRLPA